MYRPRELPFRAGLARARSAALARQSGAAGVARGCASSCPAFFGNFQHALPRAVDRTVYGDGRTFDGRILAYPYRMPSRRHKFQGLDGTGRHKNGRIREDGT